MIVKICGEIVELDNIKYVSYKKEDNCIILHNSNEKEWYCIAEDQKQYDFLKKWLEDYFVKLDLDELYKDSVNIEEYEEYEE
jgi:hypothetical protein